MPYEGKEANKALIWPIVGIYGGGILLVPIAIEKAVEARRMFRRAPEYPAAVRPSRRSSSFARILQARLMD